MQRSSIFKVVKNAEEKNISSENSAEIHMYTVYIMNGSKRIIFEKPNRSTLIISDNNGTGCCVVFQ